MGATSVVKGSENRNLRLLDIAMGRKLMVSSAYMDFLVASPWVLLARAINE
jgi:hypothetical protein